MTDRTLLVALRLIAAQAEKLATDVEKGRTYPGDVKAGLTVIAKALTDALSAEGQ